MNKPTVHIQMVETAFRVPDGDGYVRDGVSIRIEVDGKSFERIVPLPMNYEEIRQFGFVPLTRD